MMQEKVTRAFKRLKEMILTNGDTEEWKIRAWNFGAAMKDLVWFMEVVDTCVDIENFPRTVYQGTDLQNMVIFVTSSTMGIWGLVDWGFGDMGDLG